jgi:uncharacterized protein (DUF2235 family)
MARPAKSKAQVSEALDSNVPAKRQPKRLIFCFDGSWNRLSQEHPTNVVLVAESILPRTNDGIPQIVWYDEGVGTSSSDKLRGGAFGAGLVANLREAYRFLIFNYEAGDELFLFGFSRGAYTARSFAGLVRFAGILDVVSASRIDEAIDMYKKALDNDGDDPPEARWFRAKYSTRVCADRTDLDWRCRFLPQFDPATAHLLKIRYLGVWDTVGALGWPRIIPFQSWLNRNHAFHDVRLTSKIQAARHALALDEDNVLFTPSLWDNVGSLNGGAEISTYDPEAPYQQKWFPGNHGSVGGGGPERGLSDSALDWVITGARKAGLELFTEKTSRLYQLRPNALAPLVNSPNIVKGIKAWLVRQMKALLATPRKGPDDINDVAGPAQRRWLADPSYRPPSLHRVAVDLNLLPQPVYTKSIQAEHHVQPGDTLGKLAEQYLDEKARYKEIFEANRDQLDDPNVVHIGTILKIPTKA